MGNNKQYAKFFMDLAENGSKSEQGICGLFFDEFCLSLNRILENTFVYQSWEHYTGCPGYAVPPDYGAYGLGLAIRAFETMPKWEGIYGKLRMDLCRHLGEYFEELQKDD